MHKYLLVIIISLNGLTAIGQTDSISTFIINKVGHQFKAFETVGDSLYALTDDGQLIAWDLYLKDTISKIPITNKTNFTALTKSGNIIWLGSEDGKIFSYETKTKVFTNVAQIEGPVYAIAINSLGALWIASSKGVYDPLTKQTWSRFTHEPVSGYIEIKTGKPATKYYHIPQHVFLDSKDRWWLTSYHGEFGGEIELFDTRKKKILNSHYDSINMGLLFPQSVSQMPGDVILISSGLQHFENSGELITIENNKIVRKLYSTRNLFLGPAIYNENDSTIYFATHQGFFNASISNNRRIEKLMQLFTPKLLATREPLAIGQAMAIRKLAFSGNKLLFLTSFNGIGLYDGKNLYFLE